MKTAYLLLNANKSDKLFSEITPDIINSLLTAFNLRISNGNVMEVFGVTMSNVFTMGCFYHVLFDSDSSTTANLIQIAWCLANIIVITANKFEENRTPAAPNPTP